MTSDEKIVVNFKQKHTTSTALVLHPFKFDKVESKFNNSKSNIFKRLMLKYLLLYTCILLFNNALKKIFFEVNKTFKIKRSTDIMAWVQYIAMLYNIFYQKRVVSVFTQHFNWSFFPSTLKRTKSKLNFICHSTTHAYTHTAHRHNHKTFQRIERGCDAISFRYIHTFYPNLRFRQNKKITSIHKMDESSSFFFDQSIIFSWMAIWFYYMEVYVYIYTTSIYVQTYRNCVLLWWVLFSICTWCKRVATGADFENLSSKLKYLCRRIYI